MRRTSKYIVFINEILRKKFKKEVNKNIKPLDLLTKYPLVMKKYMEEIQITYEKDNKLEQLKSIEGEVDLVKNENQKTLLINKLKQLKFIALNKKPKIQEIKSYVKVSKPTVKLVSTMKIKKNITIVEKNIQTIPEQPTEQSLDNENKKPPENLNYSLDINIKFNSEPTKKLYFSLITEMENINNKVKFIETECKNETEKAKTIINELTYQKDIYDKIINAAQEEIKEILNLYENKDTDLLTKQKLLLSKKAKELFELQEKYNRLKTTQLYHINNNQLEILSKYNDNAIKARQEMTELFKSFTLAMENDKRLVDYGYIQKAIDSNEIIDNNEILKIVNEVKEQQELILNNNLQVKDIN